MAFPGAPTITTYVSATSDATSWTPFSGLSVDPGELLVFICSVDADASPAATSTASSDWTRQAGTSVNSVYRQDIYTAGPGLTSTTLQIDTTDSEQFTGILIRIPGGRIFAGLGASASQLGSCNPTVFNPGVAEDYMWLITGTHDGVTLPSGAPTNYTNFTTQARGGTGGVGSFCATRNLNASSEDPGAFSGATSGSYLTRVCAVYRVQQRSQAVMVG